MQNLWWLRLAPANVLPKALLIGLFFELCCGCIAAQGNAGGKRVIVVAADGTGDFQLVQQAVDAVPDHGNRRIVIQIKPGLYREQIRVSSAKRFLTIRGEDPKTTVLTWNISAREAGNTRLAFSMFVNADDFRAENITFENTFGVGSQAVALRVDADRAEFRNCRFLGWQDTLYINAGRQYFKDCYIEGHVDFIFGSATAFFENCEIRSKGPGYITAHFRTSDSESTVFVFYRCRLTGSNTGAGVFLGRPWRPYARVVFKECWMDQHIRIEGWDNWRDPEREKTAFFAEYKSSGPGSSPLKRVGWSRQLTKAEAEKFSRSKLFSAPHKGSPFN